MKNRKNILILMHNYAIQFIDIANQYVKLFDPNKYKVTVLYLSGNFDEIAQSRTLSEEIIFFNLPKKNIRGLKINAIQKIIRLHKKENYSLVISHRYKPIYIMLWVAKFCKIPTIIFVMHAMKTLDYLSRRLFIAAMARKNMYFAGVSNAVRDDLLKNIWHVPKERVLTLYNCIDMLAAENKLLSKMDAKKNLQLPEDAFIIGTIGRLAPEKDQKNIIHAFAKAKSHFKAVKLLIIGDGPLEQDLKQLTAKLHLEDDVIFTGFISDALRYIKAFDIFILSSTKEAFGRVLLEAMVAQVPVIGTRINGIPEVIGDAGLIVEAKDSNILSSAILKIANLSTDDYAALGKKGYERVKTNFSTDKFNEIFWLNVMSEQ